MESQETPEAFNPSRKREQGQSHIGYLRQMFERALELDDGMFLALAGTMFSTLAAQMPDFDKAVLMRIPRTRRECWARVGRIIRDGVQLEDSVNHRRSSSINAADVRDKIRSALADIASITEERDRSNAENAGRFDHSRPPDGRLLTSHGRPASESAYYRM